MTARSSLTSSRELVGCGERAEGDPVVCLNTLDELGEPGLALVAALDVDELGHRTRQNVLVLEARDRLTRRHPAVSLPVDPDEDVALRQVGPVEVARRVGASAELEHHRREPDGAHRLGHGRALRGELLEGGADENTQPLVRRADRDGGRGQGLEVNPPARRTKHHRKSSWLPIAPLAKPMSNWRLAWP
jgi:hypothetical protein